MGQELLPNPVFLPPPPTSSYNGHPLPRRVAFLFHEFTAVHATRVEVAAERVAPRIARRQNVGLAQRIEAAQLDHA
jgi:hypothetical protein